MSRTDAAYGLELLQHKRPDYDELRRYYKGDHPDVFSSEKVKEIFKAMDRKYALNLCRAAVRKTARRLDIDGWEGNDQAHEWWQTEGLRLQNRNTRESIRQGDSYLLTWPVGTMQGPLEVNRLRSDEAIVIYSQENPDRPEYGIKTWVVLEDRRDPSTAQLRVNVYYPDRAERWVTDAGQHVLDGSGNLSTRLDPEGLVPFEGEDGAGPELGYKGTIQAAGNEGILPLQHFPTQPDDTPYGESIIADLLRPQDEVNQAGRTMIAAMEAYAVPLNVFTGIMLDEQTHKVTDPDTGEDRWVTSDETPDYHPLKDWALFLPGENSRAIQLPQADVEKLLAVRRAAIQGASTVTGVPLTILTEDAGNIPSGEALRVLYSDLTDLVTDIQQDHTVPYRNVAKLHGWDANPRWAPPLQMDIQEQWDLAIKMIEAGWPVRQSIIDATGADPDVVDEVLASAVDADAELGQQLIRGFLNGDSADGLVRQ